LKYVNALADDQFLHFAASGLTIVYGDNGAGKSGYGRVLKHACRARDQEDILTNVYCTPEGKPSALIKYSIDNIIQPEITWHYRTAANPDLSYISVFDSKCASVHVDGENELAYTPVPLQLLHSLADLCLEIGRRLKAQKTALEGQIPPFRKKPASREGTAIHQAILKLSPKTQLADLSSLARISAHENERLEQLKRDLTSDPVKEIPKLKAQKQRIEAIQKLITSSEYVLNPCRNEELRQLLITAKDKTTAAQMAANEAFKKEPLPQAGSEVWKTLWEAARSFSTQEAYPGQPFPNISGSFCVLCQQQLSDTAAARLRSFEEFVQKKIQHIAEDAKCAIHTWKDTIKQSCISKETMIEAVRLFRDELDQPAICRMVVRTLAKARVRGRNLMSVTDQTQLAPQKLMASIIPQLSTFITNLDKRIEEFQKSSDPAQRRLLENELRELEDRVWLTSIMPEVEAELNRMKKIAALGLALQSTDTSRITRKTTDLSKILVTKIIRKAFEAETIALSVADRRIELTQEPSGYGSTKFRVSLTRNPQANVTQVLSEGEHRCVALAAFLAELSTAQNNSGIIFDDPISSLDHNYRELVAKRLVQEAVTGRQVIIFTHDIPFLMILDEEARKQGHTPQYQSMNRAEDRAGICIPGAPFKAKPVPEVVEKLEDRLSSTSVLHSNGRLDEWADQVKAISGFLRDGWERAAETYVSPVVKRFGNNVHPGGLRQLTILTDQDVSAYNEGYKFASVYCHTAPAALNRPIPTPAKMKEEINRLKNWFESVLMRQEKKK